MSEAESVTVILEDGSEVKINTVFKSVQDVATEISDEGLDFVSIKWNGYEKSIKRPYDDPYDEDYQWVYNTLLDWFRISNFKVRG